MRKSLAAGLVLIAAVAPATGADTPGEAPALINYGKWATPKQGDNDHHQVIYLSVPATTAGKLYLRIFDPDTGGAHDQIDKRYVTTATRFAVFGGPGAFVPGAAAPHELSKEELTAGTLLGEKTFRRDRKVDDTWQTIAELDPASGTPDGDRVVFRLLVDALTGINGNVFDVTMSTAADANVPPAGLQIFSYSPTVRMPSRGVLTEVKFHIPPGTKAVKVGNFDAAFGTTNLDTRFVTYPVVASGQGDWKETTVELPADTSEAALTISGGREYPNDTTFYVTDQDGKLLPFELPPRILPLNARPRAVALQDAMGSCTSVRFAGGLSSDPEGAPLAFRWRFGDGATATGPSVTHDYAEDGHYTAILEVTDGNPLFGNGASKALPVFVKRPPVAKSDKRVSFGAGETVAFDGAPSTASKWKVARNDWDFGDGQSATGGRVEHAWWKPGTYTVTHKVTDDSGHPCNTASEQFTVRVNAQPVAAAGADRRIAVGEETILDAGGSRDPDGAISAYAWDFGDGAAATGQVAKHAYRLAGTYTVKLHVADDSDVANSGADDELTVIVNDPPVPEAGPDQSGAIAEVLTFDGGRSIDHDGRLTAYAWDFGDGAKAAGPKVTHAYDKSGTYTVTLTVTDDSTTRTQSVSDTLKVRVNEPPVADAGKDQRVAIGETTFFDGSASSDKDDSISRYEWDFGDGGKGEGPKPTHIYGKAGTYDVKLVVTDASGTIRNTAEDHATIIVNDPPVPNAGPNQSGAIAEVLAFDGSRSLDHDGRIIAYDWDFGDGAKARGATVSHAYAKSGTYTVTLTVTDDSGTATRSVSDATKVRVNEPPVAAAGPDQRVAIGETTFFDGSASSDKDDSVALYQWDFGDGGKAEGAKPTHIYAKPGIYDVKLVVTDASKTIRNTAEDHLFITVNDPPLPSAGPNLSGAIDEVLTFDGTRSFDRDGRITAYAWDFGDGAKADGVKVTHAYGKSGTYTATLTVTDDSGTRTRTVSDATKVRVNQPPVAVAGPDQLVTASEVQFDGSASSDKDDSISLWAWDFGDGKTGDGPKPKHVYERPGTYDVKLIVTDASKTIRNTAEDHLTVIVNAVPIADAGPDLVGAPGEALTFNAGRSLDPDGSIAGYDWDFRDGATATGKMARHAFAKPGTYAVRLKVADNTGQAAAVDWSETSVFINAQPVADAGAPIASIPGAEVHLSAAGSYDTDGKLIGYRWDFSDSTEPLEGKEVTRSFKEPGVYTARLTVTDDSGAANALATDTVTITVNHQPVADAGPDVFTASSTIAFDGTRSVDADGNALAFSWDFGDGSTGTGPRVAHTYAAGGTYPVILTVDDGTGLANARSTAAISVKINRPPVAVAGENRRVCTGDVVVLDGSKSYDPEGGVLKYAWSFGDGSGADIVNPTKTYQKGGTYPVALTVKDDSGLANDTASAQIAVRVDQGPVAHAPATMLACARTETAFDGSASTDIDGVVNSYTWDFGDGGVGGGEKPSHIYDKPGNYRAFLRIEGEKIGICDPSSTAEIAVRVIAGPVAAIKAPAALPLGDVAAFDGSGSSTESGRITGWHWDFGDGTAADGAKTEHRYERPGTYQVALTLASDSEAPACRQVSARHVVTVNAPPVADAGKDRSVAIAEEAVFDASASHDADGAISAYHWDFGDGDKADGIHATHRYRKPGTYDARLTVDDGAGLANSVTSATVKVTVNPPPAPAISGPAVACVGEKVAWKAGSNGASYAWSFGDGGTASAADASHTYQKPGRYSLALLEDDGKGLANSRQLATGMVHVNQPPRADAGADQRACPGSAVSFDASGSADADGKLIRYRWEFGDGAVAEGEKVQHAFARPGTYGVRLTVTDDAGSTCSSVSDDAVVAVDAPPVADAGKDREVFIGGANDAVLLDGSASWDADGEALSHSWSIGDGSSELGERVRHTFLAAGDYPVTLTVSDTSGLACGTTSTTVHIHARQRP